MFYREGSASKMSQEEIIKSKSRVQKHGEVFTPKKIVNQMLDLPEIKEACENLTATFLEPAAGEGAFLVEILDRKLEMVAKKYNNNLIQYENYSLLVLTTLYGIELLEDNTQTCVMNMFQKYYEHYYQQVQDHEGSMNQKVLDSAKKIISLNIAHGNFLTRESVEGGAIIFSEWQPLYLRKTTKNIRIQRTEFTLDEIYENVQKEHGEVMKPAKKEPVQMDIFDLLDFEEEEPEEENKSLQYVAVNIIDIYKEKVEETDG